MNPQEAVNILARFIDECGAEDDDDKADAIEAVDVLQKLVIDAEFNAVPRKEGG